MRVGVYHDSIGTKHAGGIAVYARELAIELSSRHEVYVYTQEGEIAPELADSDVEVVTTPRFDVPTLNGRLSYSVGWPLPFGQQPISKLAMIAWSAYNDVLDHIEEHVDVLIDYQLPDDLLLSNLVDVLTICGFLSDESGGIGTALHSRYTKTETNFAISPYLADHVTETLGYDVDEVVLPGLDVDQFHPETLPAFDREEETILFVGRLIEAKGIFDLLEAVATLEQNVHLRIVGAGPAEGAIRRRARALGIADDVILEGEVPHEELPAYYTAADVFCLPTHVDSFAMVNLEAMGCGAPVVTTDLDGIKTYLTPDENGVAVPPEDPDALAAALGDLLSDPVRRQELGRNARARAREFSWSEQAAKLERLCAAELGIEPPEREQVRTRGEPVTDYTRSTYGR
ncbi:glycosyltransferase family 4 protein [Natronolimnohabitans innermongolicus]|uniref:glycosyltransferase family 4 protein n=1 Tax=Natronolimnohabitans innermongolicus TaxID=253107 RepID=UPI0006780D11|nr:glycosyltransferase family 4 protein [Natronolimnohabitans innermongolicus]